ncbi:MAG: hypothetical protein P8Y00_00775 [Deltaproteobacteria bacterium]|jgi:hypothetical protein
MEKISHILIVIRSAHYYMAAVDYGFSLARQNQAEQSHGDPFNLQPLSVKEDQHGPHVSSHAGG